MAVRAKEALLDRVEATYTLEQARYVDAVDAMALRGTQARQLAAAADAVRAAR
jgi:hypothetical protein